MELGSRRSVECDQIYPSSASLTHAPLGKDVQDLGRFRTKFVVFRFLTGCCRIPCIVDDPLHLPLECMSLVDGWPTEELPGRLRIHRVPRILRGSTSLDNCGRAS